MTIEEFTQGIVLVFCLMATSVVLPVPWLWVVKRMAARPLQLPCQHLFSSKIADCDYVKASDTQLLYLSLSHDDGAF